MAQPCEGAFRGVGIDVGDSDEFGEDTDIALISSRLKSAEDDKDVTERPV